MALSAQEVADRIAALLPSDGTPVLNRVMRVMLARDLAMPVPAELYFKATDQLVERGTVGRSRGQGGQIFCVAGEAADHVDAPAEPWREAKLMMPLRRYLEGAFCEELGLPEGSICVVKDTSRMGPALGRWARPDFILITAMRFKLMPGAQIDLHSFELKTETGANDLAVYEALAQTRFTHFGHLVWHLPKNSRAENRFSEIEKQCDQHGLGLILMLEPSDLYSYEVILDPVRKATPVTEIDSFLETRLDAKERKKLLAIVNGAPACPAR
jgi:hypothetical protein